LSSTPPSISQDGAGSLLLGDRRAYPRRVPVELGRLLHRRERHRERRRRPRRHGQLVDPVEVRHLLLRVLPDRLVGRVWAAGEAVEEPVVGDAERLAGGVPGDDAVLAQPGGGQEQRDRVAGALGAEAAEDPVQLGQEVGAVEHRRRLLGRWRVRQQLAGRERAELGPLLPQPRPAA
jgi:hypothetical protein